jgi:signal transduction histidine kinase
VHETFDLNEASRLLTVAAVNVFETAEVCLFVLDEDTGYYRLYPGLNEDDPDYASRYRLLHQLLQVAKPSASENVDWLEAHGSIIERMTTASRPLLLSEASSTDEQRPAGLGRYLTTSSSEGIDPLLAPVWTQGKMIGILVLGERGDHQQYAGPDFEAIHLILARFSPVLETARLYAQASKHVAILNTFYSATVSTGKTFQTIEDVAIDYTRVAAEAVTADAEIWLYDSKQNALRCITHDGSGILSGGQVTRLTSLERLSSLHEGDWSAYFYESDNPQAWKVSSTDVPPCLTETPHFPFAWLPLYEGQRRLGMLILTYPRSHLFSQEEKRVLGMFASQCAATMENARITLELRAAYERQKDLDRLKDQFIMTASHELRTPLTAIQGYIELLSEYNLTLTPETRGEFIAKAHRGCDELGLMVGNIMDAGMLEVDSGNIRLCPVSLAESVLHILEILEGMTKQENRVMHVDVPPTLLVMADDLRLRQVLLNLVSNALKYSSLGSEVTISADIHDEEVTLRVRDHGLGIPQVDQDHLFERFVRLNRDINSPVRGAGLGLYISKQLIEAMGGRIWVESSGNPGEGSTFAFTLKGAIVSPGINDATLARKASDAIR